MRYRLAVLTLALSATVAAASPMSGDDIRANIAGRAVYLAVPLGGEFPLNYRPGGKVDGNGEALGLGRYLSPTDTGRWWISGDQLCQRFTKWYDGAASCFRLTRTGPRSLSWVRDNGQTGTARIGAPVSD